MESAKPKVRTKPRERVANKERYAKKQRRKNAAKQLHQSMPISRKARAVVAKQGSAHAMKLSSGTTGTYSLFWMTAHVMIGCYLKSTASVMGLARC